MILLQPFGTFLHGPTKLAVLIPGSRGPDQPAALSYCCLAVVEMGERYRERVAHTSGGKLHTMGKSVSRIFILGELQLTATVDDMSGLRLGWCCTGGSFFFFCHYNTDCPFFPDTAQDI